MFATLHAAQFRVANQRVEPQHAARKEDSMTMFWRNWLTVWCGAVALFGVVLAGAAMEATSGPTRVVFQLLNAPANLELNAGMRFAVGLLGAVSIGWSMTLFAAIRLATSVDKRTAAPFWTLLTLSIAGWFLIDSAISIYTGFWRNSVSNVLIVGTFLLPLLRSRVFSAKE